MENQQLMWAELIDGVTEKMKNDSRVTIISDNGIFIVIPFFAVSCFPHIIFHIADDDALESYGIKI
jgi:hypothetical protein